MPIMDPASLLAAEQVVSTTIEGAAIASIGVAQKTHPLSAAFTQFSTVNFLPRFDHTIAVYDGHAYIFGGYGSEKELAGNELHIVKLPVEQSNPDDATEYKIVPSLADGEIDDGEVPGPRAGHSAATIGNKIYVYGGQDGTGKPLEEGGRVWCFDTSALRWSFVDPAPGTPYPSERYAHAATGSEKPSPKPEHTPHTLKDSIQEAVKKIPEMVTKPGPIITPHGTLVIVSGLALDRKLLQDVWIFDIASARWTELPRLPALFNVPTISLVDRHLYAINHPSNLEGEVLSIELPITEAIEDAQPDKVDRAASIPYWQSKSFPANPLIPAPEARLGAGLLPITTGHGRIYLLYFFGEHLSIQRTIDENGSSTFKPPTALSTMYTYQPHAAPYTAASSKDATRTAINVDSGEHSWAEVRVIPREEVSITSGGKSHPGPRTKFASAGLGLESKGGGWVHAGIEKLMGKTEEDTENGYGVLIWGGKDAKGEVTGDGWILRIK